MLNAVDMNQKYIQQKASDDYFMNLKNNFKPKVIISAYLVDKDDISEPQQAYEWITRLADHVQLWVVTRGSRLNTECGLEKHKNISLIKLEPRIKFSINSTFDKVVQPGYLEFFIAARKAIRKILKSNNIDIGHHLTPYSIRYPSPFIGQNLKFIIGPLHGGMSQPKVMKELYGREEKLYLLRKLDRFRETIDIFLQKTYKKSSKVIISAPYMKSVIRLTDDKKLNVVPGTAIDLPKLKIQKNNDTEKINFLYVGRIIASKGVELLIEAVARTKNKNYVVDLYGTGDLLKHCENLIYKYKLSHIISLKGFVNNNIILERYRDSDVLLQPSLKEPAGIALLEAMSTELPIICIDSGGPAYVVSKDCGIKIPLESKETMINQIATAIDWMIDHPNERKEMGKKSRLRVKNFFCWEAVIPQMLKIYEEII